MLWGVRYNGVYINEIYFTVHLHYYPDNVNLCTKGIAQEGQEARSREPFCDFL